MNSRMALATTKRNVQNRVKCLMCLSTIACNDLYDAHLQMASNKIKLQANTPLYPKDISHNDPQNDHTRLDS